MLLRYSSTSISIILPALFTTITKTLCSTPSYVKNYNAYNYDLTTPQFTPDGRLLQVEYAHLSTKLCSPLLVVPCKVKLQKDGQDEMCIIMATFHKNINNIRHQSRIISIPINEKNTCVGIGLSGVVSDNISLLQEVKNQVSTFTKWYGMYSPFIDNGSKNKDNDSNPYVSIENVVHQIGHSIGTECQKCSFGGGIRPYGSSIIICGLDEKEKISISVTYPSGSVVKLKQKNMKQHKFNAFALGGDDNIKHAIYKKLYEDIDSEKDDMTLSNMLKTVVNVLISSSSNDTDEDKITKEDIIDKESYNSLEIAVITKSNGMFRLEDSHIAKILNSLD